MRFILKPISLLLCFLPRRAQLALGDAMGWVWFHVIRFRREIVLSNLKLAFGNELNESQLRHLALQNFQHYGKTLIEIVASLSWSKEDFAKRVVIEGWDHLTPFLEKKTGGFLLTSHLGNWEFAICAVAARGMPLDVVVKKSRTPAAEKFLQWYRRRTGAGIFLEEGTAKDILRSLSRGRFIGFILDQFMGPPIGLPVQFFKNTAGTAAALALMSDRREEPVIPVFSYRDAGGVWHTIFEEPIFYDALSDNKEERLHQKTQRFNDVLERQIRAYPSQWLWLHRRWKPFRGESRWKLPAVGVTTIFAFMLLLAGCTAPRGKSETGIEIPPDPTIAVPSFTELENSLAVATPTPEPIKEEGPKKSKKKKPEKKVVAPPVEEKFVVIPAHQIPFAVGERLEIDLNWMAIPAGTAVMEVKQGSVFNGRKSFHLWGNVLSSRLVDAIYHVDNTIESYVDAEGLIPYKFLLHMVESAQTKETRVSFDHPSKKAFYWAKRVSQKWGPMDVDRTDVLVPNSQDMFSGFYYIRSLDFVLNQKQTIKVFENGQTLTIDLLPVANELVVSKAGAFQCWKVAVAVNLDNVLKPSGDLFIWFSDDLKHYPVRFEAKLKIGSLFGVLSSIRERL